MFPEKSNLFYLSVQKETSKLFLTNKVTKEKTKTTIYSISKKVYTKVRIKIGWSHKVDWHSVFPSFILSSSSAPSINVQK